MLSASLGFVLIFSKSLVQVEAKNMDMSVIIYVVFFFQAEDGIRDYKCGE